MSDKLNNYNLMEMLCSKLSRKQIIEDLSIKCEELYLARKSILKKDNEIEKLKGNWKILREWLENLIDNFQEDVSTPILHEQMAIRLVYEYMENLDKMNELEGNDNNE